MTIFKDSYQTTVGEVLVTKSIQTSIKESIIKDGLSHVNLNVKHSGSFKPIFITGSYQSESDIPLFTHPIMVLNHQNQDYLCTDLRFFVRRDAIVNQIEDSVKNATEFNFAKSRAILNLIWLDHGVSRIKNTLSFAGEVYAGWLAETISKAYALDFKDQTTLTVLSSYFYQTLFTDETEFDEDAKQRMVIQISKATKVPASTIFDIVDRTGPMASINDYCDNVVKVLENVRLKNFNLAMLLTIVKNSWYGANAKDIISVAIEHPPTWNAIVYTALNVRTYKNSMIYRVAERFGKRGASDDYVKAYQQMVLEMVDKDNQVQQYRNFD